MLTPSPVQSTYTRYLAPGQNGMRASERPYSVRTGISEEASAGIGFGVAVSQGDSDKGVLLGAPSSRGFVGVTVADPTLPNLSSTFTDKYAPGENVGVASKGDWWVVTADAVSPGDPVKFNTTTGALSTGTGTQIANARWGTAQATPGGLAVVELGDAADHVTAA